MVTLYDQFGREIPKRQMPERRPLAAAPILDTWRDYVSAGLTPESLTTLLKEADAGDVRRQAELFDQMEEKDSHLLGEAEKRRNAILGIEFKVKPATEDKRDVKVAEFVEEYFDNTTDWDDTLAALQDGVGKGFSALEIHWDVSSGQAMPEKLEFIEQKRFIFTDETGYLRKYPRLLSDADLMGAAIPAWKIIFHRYGGKAGHAVKSAIYRVCAWMYLFKNYSLKDWIAFLEVFGMPLRLGKYDSGAGKDDKDALITAIQSLGSDAAGIISKNTEIEFIEAVKGSGKSDNPYLAMAEFCDKAMSKALLGQTLTADVGDKGSYAAAKTHNEVRQDLAQADTRAVAVTVRYQLIRPMVGFNFGWDTPCPGYAPVWEEEEDLEKKSTWIGNLLDRGVEMPVSFIRKEFNIPEPEKGEAVVSGQRSGVLDRQTAKEFLKVSAKNSPERPDETPADTLAALGDKIATGAEFDGLTAKIEEILAQAASLEEFRDRIMDAYADMDASDLGDLMQKAFVLADLSGRFDVAER